MAGPIDTRIAPTKVNDLANEKPIEWFRDKMIGIMPARLEGRRTGGSIPASCSFPPS